MSMIRTAIFLVVLHALAIVPGSAGGIRDTVTPASDMSVYPVHVLYEFSKDRLPTTYPYHAELAEEKFGLKFEYEYVPGTQTVEKVDILFAAGDYFDMHPYGLRVWEINRWAMQGHIVALSDYWNRFPNYRSWWDAETWQTVETFTTAPDRRLYLLPSQNPRTISRAWTYRKDLFDDLGLSWPGTVEEYYDVLRRIKEAYPDHYPLFTRGSGGIFTDVTEASWRTSGDVHFDVDTGLLVYGPATDKYRALLTYFARLYRERLMDPEYITNTRQRENEILYVKNTAVTVPNWTGNVPAMNRSSRRYNPNVTWDYDFRTLRADPGQDMLVTYEPPYHPWGPFLTTAVTGDKRDRLIEYLDWIFSEEGMTARYFGKEGETFVYTDGKPVFMDHMQSRSNPNGDPMWKWGLENYPIFHPDRELTKGDEIYAEMTAWAKGKEHIQPVPWGFTKAEDRDRADIERIVTAVRDRYRHAFVLGELDAGSDGDWRLFQEELRNAGIDRLLALYLKTYERSRSR